MTNSLHAGGLIPGGTMDAVVGDGAPDYVIPLRAWQRAHEPAKVIVSARQLQMPAPDFYATEHFIGDLLAKIFDRQREEFAALPTPPEDYRWMIVQEWPDLDLGSREYKVAWRWVLRPINEEDAL